MPILNRHITVIGIEEAIFYSGVFFSLSLCLMGGAQYFNERDNFMWLVFASSLTAGFGAAVQVVGESALLLRYSEWEDH
jgi:hypothetical protein